MFSDQPDQIIITPYGTAGTKGTDHLKKENVPLVPASTTWHVSSQSIHPVQPHAKSLYVNRIDWSQEPGLHPGGPLLFEDDDGTVPTKVWKNFMRWGSVAVEDDWLPAWTGEIPSNGSEAEIATDFV
jgi:hypothetical protein